MDASEATSTILDFTTRALLCPTPCPPPLVPESLFYTPFWCEENTVLLLRSLQNRALPPTRSYAIFITNSARSAILFQQKASQRGPEPGHYVIWDYHVIVLTVEQDGSMWVFDQDSRLGMPIPWEAYLESTFRPDLFAEAILPLSLSCRFRVVRSDVMSSNFASDRSHMLLPPPAPELDQSTTDTTEKSPLPSAPEGHAPIYIHPPPNYPALLGAAAKLRGETNNLFSHFLDVRLAGEGGVHLDKEKYGEVVGSVSELLERTW